MSHDTNKITKNESTIFFGDIDRTKIMKINENDS